MTMTIGGVTEANRLDANEGESITIADSHIVDPNTGEVIAECGDTLDDEVLYRLEMIGRDAYYQARVDAVRREMEAGDISPVVAELRIGRIMSEAGWRPAGSLYYRP